MQKHYAEGLYSNNFLAEQYHVDAAYRRSSMVCLSVGLSVTIVSPAKAAKLIEMLLGCGLGWAQGSMCLMGVCIGAIWQILFNCPFVSAMQPMSN